MSKRSLFVGVLSLLTLPLQLFATILPFKSFDDLVKESDGIVAARVANLESQYSPNKEIYTFITFDQVEALSGNFHGQSLSLRFKGGRVGNDILDVEGSPNLQVNDRVVLFIQGNGKYMVPVVGWTQGVFRIMQDSKTGQQVIRDHEGNSVQGIRAGLVLKEQKFQPESQIVGPLQIVRSEVARNSGNAGVADNGSTSAAVAAPQGPEKAAMTAQAFLDIVRRAGSKKARVAELRSVAVGDFSMPDDSKDLSVEPGKPAGQGARDGTPVLPKKTPRSHSKDQR